MKISKRWLQKKSACTEGMVIIDWVVANCKNGEAVDVIRALMDHRLDWANWLIVRVMDRPQKLAYAIFAAEQVIDIFEKKYPNNKAPREAIEAAKAVLENDTQENRDIAAIKRRAAADAYAAAAAADAADAAAAADADAARKQMQIKILEYGLSLLKDK